jgi:hypothetical protein
MSGLRRLEGWQDELLLAARRSGEDVGPEQAPRPDRLGARLRGFGADHRDRVGLEVDAGPSPGGELAGCGVQRALLRRIAETGPRRRDELGEPGRDQAGLVRDRRNVGRLCERRRAISSSKPNGGSNWWFIIMCPQICG